MKATEMADVVELKSREQVEAYLAAHFQRRDEDVNLAYAALALGSLDRPMVDLDRYVRHLARLVEETKARIDATPGRLETRISALNTVLFEDQGYDGDRQTYDDLQNANLMRVIDRRKGLPISLSILYLHVARALDWRAEGINFPGHFLVRLNEGSDGAVIDPFNAGIVYSAAELRELIKAAMGPDAELSPEHYAAATNRDILLRLQNNIKMRMIQASDFGPALAVVERMKLIAPENPVLWHEGGVLNAHLGNLRAAIDSLHHVAALDADSTLQHQVAVLLQQLRSKLN